MDVTIRGRGVEQLTPSLKAIVEEKVRRVGKFLEGMERAEVRFVEERNPRIAEKESCEVTMHGHGHIVRAKAHAADAQQALDRVVDKLEHRMEKLKGRLVGRSHPRRGGEVRSAANGAVGLLVDDDVERTTEEEVAARIVRTKQFAIKPMTPEEGALQMDLLGHDFYLFTNADTGRAAVVYRRDDGDIGLIDT